MIILTEKIDHQRAKKEMLGLIIGTSTSASAFSIAGAPPALGSHCGHPHRPCFSASSLRSDLGMMLSSDEPAKDFIPKKAGVEDKVDDVPGHVFIADKPSEDPDITCYMKPDSEFDAKPKWVCTGRRALGNAGDADDTY